jgi:hypothetical protein
MRLFMKLLPANAVIIGTEEVPVTTYDLAGNPTTIMETRNILDWYGALQKAAQEVNALNAISGLEPIYANPDAIQWVPEVTDIDGVVTVAHWEGRPELVFSNCGLPSADGKLELDVPNYNSIELDLLPAVPTTFTFILGIPSGAGKLI